MLSTEERTCIAGVADDCAIEPAALAAVVAVESGGRVTARVAGRDEPLIRWEAHYFDRLCRPGVRAKARKLRLSAPRAGAIANPPTQPGRWALLKRAADLDHDAAYQSCSWGVGQVMGAHWRDLGYADVDGLVAEARSCLEGQVRLMTRFIEQAGLTAALKARDWQAFARGYNGPAYRRSGYDAKLAQAYAIVSTAPDDGHGFLKRGDTGAGVVGLQKALSHTGIATTADGVFGCRTEAALRTFQTRHGLAVDGVAGPGTLAALERAAPAAA